MTGLLLALAVLLWPGRPAPVGPPSRGSASATGGGTAAPRPGLRRPVPMLGAGERRRAAADAELLVLLELLGPALRAGLPVIAALDGPGGGTALGAALRAAGSAGDPLGPVWGEWAARVGSDAARVVSRVWRLGERLGSPLADGVEDAAESVRAGADRRRRVATAVAGPRATAHLLTLLPVAGPPLSLALGLRPDELWGGVGGPLAFVGAGLVVLGHVWCRALLRAVTRPRPAGAG
ncbi:type II secretion system F family protein [Lapillicoccus jejuensis]|uniref:Tight adherence protein B n=1 Tax=Lapillicoccus jejuensis TaxID=402171 RepID=A0A542DXR4_9MICO|nr:hypothetical protein [Lapillicoccus jejuensis]TQJ07878.1 tight adherence protein B [Lapillicoccus jejuensis]